MKNVETKRVVFSGLMLALGMVLPFLTGQIKTFGEMLLPMHIPVMICGFVCGWKYGLIVGAACPVLRYLFFLMPPIFPTGIAMAFELAAYGAVAGLLYKLMPKKLPYAYIALVFSMLAGRIVWGIVRYRISIIDPQKASFTMNQFIAGAFLKAYPGIILQLVLIPFILELFKKMKVMYNFGPKQTEK
ncbi:MAG: ECF transporter S component [Clostridia bacterium]|nr:ECF transporter S component [Clostridia bacterium]